jgi:PAS domain S-box-containing protein
MGFTPSFKILFIDDLLKAKFVIHRMKVFNPRLVVNNCSDITNCIVQICPRIQNGDLLWFNFYFFNELIMALPGDTIGPELEVWFVEDRKINGIALDIVKTSRFGQYSTSLNFVQPNSTIIHGFYSGTELKQRPRRFTSHLSEKIDILTILKSILPVTRDYLNLQELMDSCFQKLLHCLEAKSGVLEISQKETAKQIFGGEYGQESLNKLVGKMPQSHQANVLVRNVSEIPGRLISQKIRSLGVNAIISSFITSKFFEGHFLISTVQERIAQREMTLLELFRTQIGIFLDNTLYFQGLLKMLNNEVSLVEPREDGVMIVDAEKRVMEINVETELLTGWKKNDALGRQCKDLWQSCDYFGKPMCNSARCPMEKVLKQGKKVMANEVRYTTKRGESRVCKSDYALDFDDEGQISHGVAMVRDVTDRIRLQERFFKLEQMANLGDFASELAHDIRNPITGISSSAQYLYESAGVKEEHKRIIEDILIGAHQLEKTVRKYLGMARSAEPRRERCELNRLIGELVRFLATKMERDGIILETDFGDDLPNLFVDIDQVRQVYMNVLLNAMDAMPSGGKITIKTILEISETDSTSILKRKKVVSVIGDSGCGISSRDVGRILEAFYTTKTSGSGLGLYTAHNILRKHKAEINFLSEAGLGTEVIISFPVETEYEE